MEEEEFFGDKSAGHFAGLDPFKLNRNRYQLCIVYSAQRLIKKEGDSAKSWKYLTQYSTGNCAWKGPDGKGVIL
jgi:hypothetical protein